MRDDVRPWRDRWISTSCPDLVRDELLGRCRTEQIEPPAAGRLDRIVRSALHQAEQTLTARLASRLPIEVAGRLRALIAVEVSDDETGAESVLALIMNVSAPSGGAPGLSIPQGSGDRCRLAVRRSGR